MWKVLIGGRVRKHIVTHSAVSVTRPFCSYLQIAFPAQYLHNHFGMFYGANMYSRLYDQDEQPFEIPECRLSAWIEAHRLMLHETTHLAWLRDAFCALFEMFHSERHTYFTHSGSPHHIGFVQSIDDRFDAAKITCADISKTCGGVTCHRVPRIAALLTVRRPNAARPFPFGAP